MFKYMKCIIYCNLYVYYLLTENHDCSQTVFCDLHCHNSHVYACQFCGDNYPLLIGSCDIIINVVTIYKIKYKQYLSYTSTCESESSLVWQQHDNFPVSG